MSKFKCTCGEVIYDQTDHLPYKGYLFADHDYFELFDKISTDIAALMQARLAGKEKEWHQGYFQNDKATTMADHDLVFMMIARQLLHGHVAVYQCPKCGRLNVEHRDERSRLSSFVPDKTPHRDIFSK